MTEAEWFACTDPEVMRRFVTGRASGRKLRLFACACSRRVWGQLFGPASCTAVEFAERFADGRATCDELEVARHAAGAEEPENPACYAAREDAGEAAAFAHCWAAVLAADQLGCDPAAHADELVEERAAQSCVIRDIFGNPFRPVPGIDPVWLSWNGGTVATLAQAAYEERELPSGHLDPPRLAILADSLEDVGCTDPDILGHLRDTGPHVRGCWVLDLLLGKG